MGDADASSAAVRIFSSSSSEVFPSPVREGGGSPFSPVSSSSKREKCR